MTSRRPPRLRSLPARLALFCVAAASLAGCATDLASMRAVSDIHDAITQMDEPRCVDARSCTAEGLRYLRGDGVLRNEAVALVHFERACRDHHSWACAHLEALYDIDALRDQATAYHQRQCEAGLGQACLDLDTLRLLTGESPKARLAALERPCVELALEPVCQRRALLTVTTSPSTLNERLEDLSAACGAGGLEVCVALSQVFISSSEVSRDLPRALGFASTACEGGDPRGCRLHALLAELIELDEARAASGAIIERACDGGDAAACALLAERLYATDLERARALHATTCEDPVTVGCRSLAERLQRTDPEGARDLLEAACASGDGPSCAARAAALKKTKTKDKAAYQKLLKRALELALAACEAGDAESCLLVSVTDHESGRTQGPDPPPWPAPSQALTILQTACAAGDPRACTNLAWTYERGVPFTTTSQPDATDAYVSACVLGDAIGCNHAGFRLMVGQGAPQQNVAAKRYFERSCASGYAPGCNNLGTMHFRGRGVPTDHDKARAIFEGACALDSPEACFHVGLIFEEGHGVERSTLKAAPFHSRACNLGVSHSCAQIARWHKDGAIGPPDLDKARDFFDQACAAEDADACVEAARLHTKDAPDTAVARLLHAISLGSRPAQLELARLRRAGVGVEKAPKMAFEAFELQCTSYNVTEACLDMADMISAGEIEPEDPKTLETLYNDTCQRGAIEACTRLIDLIGAACEEKRDPPKCVLLSVALKKRNAAGDSARARAIDNGLVALLKKGCKRDAEQCVALGTLYREGKGVVRDYKVALELFYKGCDAKNARACFITAEMFERGQGVRGTRPFIKELYQKACKLGSQEACKRGK